MDDPRSGIEAAPVPLHFRGQITAQRLAALRRLLADWATGAGLDADAVDAVVLSGYEALANVVEHAYRGEGGLVEFDAVRVDHTVIVTVADHGRWRITSRTPSQGGRGLVLIRGLSDQAVVDGSDHGTTVTMTWLLAGS